MSSIPEINGSSGAFLAVVISLSVFVAVCCIAIFWLLKFHQPTPTDRMRRKEELEAARTAENSLRSLDPRSLKARIGRAFGRKGSNWAHAPAREEDEAPTGWSELRNRSDPTPTTYTPTTYHDGGTAESHQNSLSTSSVQLSPPLQPRVVNFPIYDEPWSRTVDSPEPSLTSATLSAADAYIFTPPRTISIDISSEGSLDDQHFWIHGRHSVDGNPMQMKKSDKGSRFQESIP